MASGKATSTRALRSALLAPFQEFAQTGALGGLVLLSIGLIALVWANSPWAGSYHVLWEHEVSIGWGEQSFSLTLHHWINDGLMVVFFLLVGLEIKRELLVGELASPRQAALPIVAAIGGMVLPAAAYALLNTSSPGASGWGVPMATDIAFVLGVLALLGPNVPVGLKVFLTALAIVDDLGAVLVIALFYTSNLDVVSLIGAAVALGGLIVMNRRQVSRLGPYLAVGVALWIFVLRSGVHATIAGVLLALAIPAGTRIDTMAFLARGRRILDDFERAESGDRQVLTSPEQQEAIYALDLAASEASSPLLRLEHMLHSFVAYVVMPLFALANAGVPLGSAGDALRGSVTWGVIVGLVAGKFVGIATFSWIAVRARWAVLPPGVTWRHLRAGAALGGIGFTMSLFVAGLAFEAPAAFEQAKLGVLAGSTLAGIAGYLLLRRAGRSGAADAAGGTAPTPVN